MALDLTDLTEWLDPIKTSLTTSLFEFLYHNDVGFDYFFTKYSANIYRGKPYAMMRVYVDNPMDFGDDMIAVAVADTLSKRLEKNEQYLVAIRNLDKSKDGKYIVTCSFLR